MLSAWVFTADVILMWKEGEINSERFDAPEPARQAGYGVRPWWGAPWRGTFLLAVALVAAGGAFVSCSPALIDKTGGVLNPLEILDKSPRIYEIAFKSIGDSIETDRASSYIMGSLDLSAIPSDKVAAAMHDSTRIARLTPRERAQLEYVKATRRDDVGAEQAAAGHLKSAMSADPSYRPPYILLGRMLVERGALRQAYDLYSQVLSWDSTDADALVGIAQCHMRMGNLDDARRALVDAVIFDRDNLEAWSALSTVLGHEGLSIVDHDAPDLGLARPVRGRHYEILVDTSLEDCPTEATAWIAYASERAVWRYEGKYKRFFGVTRYMPTYEEDVDCYMVLAAAWRTLAKSDTVGYNEPCDPAYLDYLSRVADDGYLVSHVLFDHVCVGAPGAARHFSAEVLDKLREYVNTYVIVKDN
jgi:tetratricopeptide (TPR) repeat protein